MTLAEPSAGSGAMLIAAHKYVLNMGFNPQKQLWVEAIEIDYTCAQMCYIQMSLLGISGRVRWGDSLVDKYNDTWYTLFHLLGNWQSRLSQEIQAIDTEDETATSLPDADVIAEAQIDVVEDPEAVIPVQVNDAKDSKEPKEPEQKLKRIPVQEVLF